MEDKKIINNIVPFNDVYINCYYSALFPVIIAFGKNISSFLINDFVLLKYDNIKEKLETSICKIISEEDLFLMGIVSFPKVLRINKDLVNSISDTSFKEKIDKLLKMEMLVEAASDYVLTQKGTWYIDNIYMALLTDEERNEVLKSIKIHVIE